MANTTTPKASMNIVISSEYFTANAKLLMTSTLSLVAVIGLNFFWIWDREEAEKDQRDSLLQDKII